MRVFMVHPRFGVFCTDPIMSATAVFQREIHRLDDILQEYRKACEDWKFTFMEKMRRLRSSWNVSARIGISLPPLVNLRPLCRRMMFSMSGWLARKGRKYRKGR